MGADVTVPGIVISLSGFYIGWHVDCYMGGLSELCHKWK